MAFMISSAHRTASAIALIVAGTLFPLSNGARCALRECSAKGPVEIRGLGFALARCNAEFSCPIGKCTATSGTRTCVAGKFVNQQYAFLVELPNKCAGTATYFAASLSEGKECARKDGLPPLDAACWYWVNLDNWEVQVAAASEQNALRCAVNQYDPTCTDPRVVQYGGCFNRP
jgi:hypothetical protein